MKNSWRKAWKISLAALFAGLLAGCAPIGGASVWVLNLMVPRSGYSAVRDLSYGSDPRQKLDLYVPDKLTAPAPVLVFFYGGSWDSGTKDLYLAFGQAFASQGIIVAVADYRLYPQVRYPAFVEDSAAAFAFVHAHAAQYGGDPKRVFVSGHSAGAYNAMMLAADRDYLANAGSSINDICGVLGLAGPYDFLPLTDPELITIFGGNNRPETQPITYIDGKRPPMFLAHDPKDTTVLPRNSYNLAAKLKAFGSPVTLKLYTGVGHIGLILSLAPGFRLRNSLRADMTNFIKDTPCHP